MSKIREEGYEERENVRISQGQEIFDEESTIDITNLEPFAKHFSLTQTTYPPSQHRPRYPLRVTWLFSLKVTATMSPMRNYGVQASRVVQER